MYRCIPAHSAPLEFCWNKMNNTRAVGRSNKWYFRKSIISLESPVNTYNVFSKMIYTYGNIVPDISPTISLWRAVIYLSRNSRVPFGNLETVAEGWALQLVIHPYIDQVLSIRTVEANFHQWKIETSNEEKTKGQIIEY